MELVHIAVDEVVGKSVDELEAIAKECDELKAAVQAELQAQAQKALAALQKTRGGSVAPEGKKRGRKPKQAAADESDEPEVTSDDDSDEETNGLSLS